MCCDASVSVSGAVQTGAVVASVGACVGYSEECVSIPESRSLMLMVVSAGAVGLSCFFSPFPASITENTITPATAIIKPPANRMVGSLGLSE